MCIRDRYNLGEYTDGAVLDPRTCTPISYDDLIVYIQSRLSIWRTIDVTMDASLPNGDLFDFLPGILACVYPITVVCVLQVNAMVTVPAATSSQSHPAVHRYHPK